MKAPDLSIRKTANELKSVDGLWGSGFNPGVKKHPDDLRHRSDMLIDKQIHVAYKVTKALDDAVSKYEKSYTTDDRKILEKLFVLTRMTQHLKLIMEILYKLNLEIRFCRGKLHDAVRDHKEEAELIRQRTMWLERKLEKIIEANSIESIYEKFKTPTSTTKSVAPSQSNLQGDYLIPKSLMPPKKVVMLAPLHDENDADVESLNIGIPEEGDRYWLAGHHRFSYTANMGCLLEDNPLSYHNIGLAVPASYVDKEIFKSESSQSSLPWMSEQDPMQGNFDILRDDLDRIRKRIHRIQDKIYAAANLSLDAEVSPNSSVNPQSQDTTRFQNSSPQPSGTVGSMIGRQSTRGMTRSIAAGSLARISSSTTQASSSFAVSSELMYPIPFNSDAMMPLTRTNMGLCYPHRSDRWCDVQPNQDGPAKQPSIVNQRNLLDRTKLRLFIPKKAKRREKVIRDLVTPSSVQSNRSYRKIPNTVRFVENLKSTEGSFLSQIQKQRLHELIETLSTSSRLDERIYSVRSLASLGVTASDETIPALIETLEKEKSSSVRYEISKALIKLGEWHPSALKELTEQLRNRNSIVCLDVMEQLSCSEAVRSMHFHIDEMSELRDLIQTLHLLVCDKDGDEVSFQAAVCLGEISGTYDEVYAKAATKKLVGIVKTTSKWEWHSQALEVLVRRLNHFDGATLSAIISQLKEAIKGQDRLAAALLIAYSGPPKVFRIMKENEAFETLYPKLWDDPKRDVRLGVSQALTSLGLRSRLMEELDEQIKDASTEIRSHAVMAISAVGIRSDKTLRSLVEMLGLDSSDYVRLQIIRAFNALAITDIRVVRALREREKAGGPLAREASKTLTSLDVRLTTGVTSTSEQRGRSGKLNTATGRLTTASSWFSASLYGGHDTRQSLKRMRQLAASGSRQSSSLNSSPRYEIISTSVSRTKISPSRLRRTATGQSMYLTSASSFF